MLLESRRSFQNAGSPYHRPQVVGLLLQGHPQQGSPINRSCHVMTRAGVFLAGYVVSSTDHHTFRWLTTKTIVFAGSYSEALFKFYKEPTQKMVLVVESKRNGFVGSSQRVKGLKFGPLPSTTKTILFWITYTFYIGLYKRNLETRMAGTMVCL